MNPKIKEAIDYFKDVEALIGIEAINVRQLNDDATDEEIRKAKSLDRRFFQGLGDAIRNAV